MFEVAFSRPIRGLSVGVDRHTNQASGKVAFELVAGGQKRRVRAAEAHRHAEPLARPNDGICAPLAGRDEQGQRQQVGRDQNERAARVQCVADRTIIAYVAPDARILQQRGEAIGARRGPRRPDHDRQTKWCGTRAHDVEGLRQDIVGDVDGGAFALADAVRERHCLGGRSRLVEHRRVRDRHAGEIADHRLEIDQRFEATLRYLRLVRCIRRVPRRILEHVAQDHSGCQRSVIALPDVRLHHPVFARHRLQQIEGFLLAFRGGQRQRLRAPDRRGHNRVDQRRPRGIAQCLQHLTLIGFAGADMAVH